MYKQVPLIFRPKCLEGFDYSYTHMYQINQKIYFDQNNSGALDVNFKIHYFSY